MDNKLYYAKKSKEIKDYITQSDKRIILMENQAGIGGFYLFNYFALTLVPPTGYDFEIINTFDSQKNTILDKKIHCF